MTMMNPNGDTILLISPLVTCGLELYVCWLHLQLTRIKFSVRLIISLWSLEWNNFMYRLNTPIESRQITFSNIAVILRTDLKACTKKRCAYGSLCWTSFVLLSNDNLSLHDEKERKKTREWRDFFFFFFEIETK